jgi:membrane-associated phospholipid phosphatase
MKFKLLILLLLIVSFKLSLLAQDSLKIQEMNKYNLSEFVHEAGLLVIRPIKWNGYDWIKFGAVGVITVAIMQEDQKISTFALNNPKYSKSTIMEVGNQYGGFFFGPILCVSLYTIGSMAKNHKTKKIGFEMAQGLLYSEGISFISKGIIGRARPSASPSAFDYQPFTFFKSPYNSFPAGHIDAAFALSTILSKNTDCVFLKVIAYIPATLTVVSRIYQNYHWTSDVFIGAVIGTSVGNWVVNLHDKKESRIQLTSFYPLAFKIGLN